MDINKDSAIYFYCFFVNIYSNKYCYVYGNLVLNNNLTQLFVSPVQTNLDPMLFFQKGFISLKETV